MHPNFSMTTPLAVTTISVMIITIDFVKGDRITSQDSLTMPQSPARVKTAAAHHLPGPDHHQHRC